MIRWHYFSFYDALLIIFKNTNIKRAINIVSFFESVFFIVFLLLLIKAFFFCVSDFRDFIHSGITDLPVSLDIDSADLHLLASCNSRNS